MKMAKKLLSFFLVAVLALTTIQYNSAEVDAATKLSLRCSKVQTLVAGETTIININLAKSQVTFKTSNKSIATVTKTGKVKAVAAGKAVITVKKKVGTGSVKVTIKVNPTKVKNVVATEASNTSIKVSWTKLKNVTGYMIYQSTSASGSFALVNTTKSNVSSVTLTNLAASKTYYYKVKAYRTFNGTKYMGAISDNNKNTSTGTSYQSSKSYFNSAKTYALKWSDEFNYTDKSQLEENWTYEIGNGNNGWGNNELEYYTAGDNVVLEDGKLVIVPKYDASAGYKYTSTRIITKDKRTFKYGKIEFRAKLPSAQGTWAAGWMLANNNNWPATGEIDVYETMSGNLTTIPQSIHNSKFNGMSGSAANKHWDTVVSTATSEYHTYGIIWTSDSVTFTIDGVETGTYNPLNYSRTKTSAYWPFDNDFFLILNVAIGGTLGGGNTIASSSSMSAALNTDASNMYVDYVRVYQ